MKAFYSGQAGAAVVPGLKPQVRTGHSAALAPWNSSDALRLFDGCTDVQGTKVDSLGELDELTKLAWAQDRALRLFLFLLDPTEPSEELFDYADCMAELLETYPILMFLKRRLAARPLPNFIEVVRIEEACKSIPVVHDLFVWVLSAQSAIARVRAAYDAVPVVSFSGENEKAALDEKLISDGAYFDVATALLQEIDLSFLKLQVVSNHRAFSSALAEWFGNLQSGLKKLPKSLLRHEEVEARDDQYVDDEARLPSYAAFSSVIAQQRSIVAKLKENDVESARWLMSEMIASQQNHSTKEQIAKSFSKMAQQAKIHDVPVLQLEWSQAATEANPLDPMTFGHLADALIDIGQYSEAESALDSVGANGDPLFADTGRARIMRAMNRVSEAREAFLITAKKYAGFPEVVHAELGAAEALRELGDAQGALLEYKKLSENWPLEPSVWNGLASTLMDLGKLDEALQTYSKAASYDRGVIPKIGRANAYKVVGHLDMALGIYDSILEDYPNNQVALCGRAGVLQDQGKLVAALAGYELAIERSPYRPEPLLGKARSLRYMGHFMEAIEVYKSALLLFPSDRRAASGLILVHRAQGRFDDALILADKYIANFPFDVSGRVIRANLLSRLGKNTEALHAFDSILVEKPMFSDALLGKAALLIKLQRDSDAALILPEQNPRTRHDWRRFLLRVSLLEQKIGSEKSVKMLRRHIPLCPFAAERRRMRDLLVSIELCRNHWMEARRIVETTPEEISNVVALHVLAATYRPGQARIRLERIRESEGPADVINLAEEIARRHKLELGQPQQTAEWIRATERNLILADAA